MYLSFILTSISPPSKKDVDWYRPSVVMFLLGFNKRLGSGSSVNLYLSQSVIYEPALLQEIFELTFTKVRRVNRIVSEKGIPFFENQYIEFKLLTSEKWTAATILKTSGSKIKVHYDNWWSRSDEELDVNDDSISARIRMV